jgi:hypothetical protein
MCCLAGASAPNGLRVQEERSASYRLETLLDELKDMPSNRGVCLEGVAAIVETCVRRLRAPDSS